jgi:dynein heavy chain 1
MKSEVQELVRDGCNITWESYKLESFVQKFSELIFNFQERVDDVLLYTNQIDELILSLENCEYKSVIFKDVLDQIQKLIDDLNLRSYSNLSAWVMNVDTQVGGGILAC